MNEQTVNILTIDELEKYIGKLIVCYYYNDYLVEFNDHLIQRPNLAKENIMCMWMFKLTSICKENITDNTVRGKTIYGVNTMVLHDAQAPKTTPRIIGGFYRSVGKDEPSSAQAYVRTPTKQELTTYMNIFRHIRIFGT